MAKSTKMSIKIKGTPKGVQKALSQIVTDAPVERTVPLREADFRAQQKRQNNASR